jgi:hypothetical protein
MTSSKELQQRCADEQYHDFQVVRRTWQHVNNLRYQVLDSSEECLVCKRCGAVINPWQRTECELAGEKA